jgi:hypothetical protein
MGCQKLHKMARNILTGQPDYDTIEWPTRHSVATIRVLHHDIFALERHELLQGTVAELAIAFNRRHAARKHRHNGGCKARTCTDFQNTVSRFQIERRDNPRLIVDTFNILTAIKRCGALAESKMRPLMPRALIRITKDANPSLSESCGRSDTA